jgi:NADH-quinone oxidoreductase subunit F
MMMEQIQTTKVIVGLGSCGIAAGAVKTYNRIKELTSSGLGGFELAKTSCIGMCYKEPLVEIQDASGSVIYGDMTEDKIEDVLRNHLNGVVDRDKVVSSGHMSGTEEAFFDGQVKIALRNCGYMDPEVIEEAEQREAYAAIKKIFETGMGPEQVIAEVLASGLRGRGGGGFPTGLKWKFAFQSESDEKYIICNADEGDPGAFMDRSLLEGDPHAVLEGMMIGGYAIGATAGVIYCRAEYPLAIKRLNIAIDQARSKGYLGKNAMGRNGFNFDIYVKEGAGAFVCGEETALIASIEGQRGMPRKRPPFPAVSGLWKKPTNINNVETWANIPWIINKGAAAYAAYGTEKSKGTKVFALTGKIRNGGLVEVPMGISINDIIFKLGGGIQNDRKFKAVQLGGPSGGCIPAELGHTPVDYDSVTATGAIMGSGGMVVMDETTCMIDLAKFFLHFTQEESCGKCTFCRIGTKRMLEILERITDGKGKAEDLDTLELLAYQIKDNSLCGLGQTAPNPVLTTLKYFKNEYEAHIFDKKCPAKVCKPLLSYTIDSEKCTGCTVCAKKCPTAAIDGGRKQVHLIRTEACIRCGECFTVCKFDAVLVD